MNLIFRLGLGSLLLMMLAYTGLMAQMRLGSDVQAFMEGKMVVEPKYKKELKLAEEQFAYLRELPHYSRSFGTRIYPASGLFSRSVQTSKSAFLYSLQSQKFTGIASKIQRGDVVSLTSVYSYTMAGFSEPKLNPNEALTGWVAVHYFTLKNKSGEEEKQMMVFFLEKKGNKLELVDAGEWFLYDHTQVEETIKKYWGTAKQEMDRILGAEHIATTPITEEPDSVATFVGGQEQLVRYLMSAIDYPETAAEFGVEGRVVVEFVVEADGSISSAQVRTSLESSLDLEALRVVLAMPKWRPAFKGGVPIRSKFVLPIAFRTEA